MTEKTTAEIEISRRALDLIEKFVEIRELEDGGYTALVDSLTELLYKGLSMINLYGEHPECWNAQQVKKNLADVLMGWADPYEYIEKTLGWASPIDWEALENQE